MTPRPQLIRGPEPGHSWPSGRANVAVLYVLPNGTIITGQGRTADRLWRLLRFCRRYEVDLHDHLRTVELRTRPLPTRGNTFCFESQLDVGFRVTDPVEVLRRNIVDGCEVVYQYLSTLLRPVTRQFSIEEADRAEAEINRLFRREVPLEEGLTIFRCLARLTPDAAARAYLAARSDAVRRMEVGRLEHGLAKAAAKGEAQIQRIAHRGELDRRAESLLRLGGRPIDPFQVLLAHLAEQPDASAEAVQLMIKVWERALDRENARDQRAVDVLKDLLNRGVVRPADVEAFRDEITRRVRDGAVPEEPAVPLLRPWDGRPVFAGGPLRAAPDRPTGADDADAAGVAVAPAWPVYLVVDESPRFAPFLDCVNESLRRLTRELARNPDVNRTLRLTVVGCAGTTVPRLRPDDPASNGHRAELRTRPGARYGPAFDRLAELLAADVRSAAADDFLVHTPLVFFLTGGLPDDEPDWRDAHRRLLDLACGGPQVIACGVGSVPSRLVAEVASQPADGLAVTGPDVEGELRRFMTVLRSSLLAGARAMAAGQTGVQLHDFDQFRRPG